MFSILLGAAIAVVILRRRGLYFSLLTLAFSQVAFEIAFKWTALTGGENGIQGVRRPLFPSDLGFHVFVVVTVTLVMGALWRLVHTPFGRALQAMRDNELRMKSLGYNTFALKFRAFVIMGAVIGYAGGLLAIMLRGAYADNLSWQHAGDALLMAVLGGVHQFLGPLFGAIVFTLLQDQLSSLLETWWLIFAPIIIAFALLSPEGIVGLARRMLRLPGWTLVRPTIPPRPAVIPPLARARDPGRSRRADPDRAGPEQAFRQPGHSQRHRARRSSVPAAQLHRSERRGEDDLLQHAVGRAAAECRRDPLRGPRHHAHCRCTGARCSASAVRSRSCRCSRSSPCSRTCGSRCRRRMRRSKGWRGVLARCACRRRCEPEGLVAAARGRASTIRRECCAANLAHGAKRLLEIAITLALEARLLLLDEPLAGLAESDRHVVAALIRRLAGTHAVLLIEHDIDRVLKLSDRITVLHQGRLIADGKPAEVAADPGVVTAYLGAAGPRRRSRRGRAPAPADAESARELLRVDGTFGRLWRQHGAERRRSAWSAKARRLRCSAATASARRRRCARSPARCGRMRAGSPSGARTSRAVPTYEINRAGISLVPEGRRLFPNLTVIENLRLAARPGGISIDEAFALFPRLRNAARGRRRKTSPAASGRWWRSPAR